MLALSAAAIVVLAVWYSNAGSAKEGEIGAVLARTPAQIKSADALLARSRTLSPDTSPEIGQAYLLIKRGRRGEAAVMLRAVLAREPRNLLAWRYLAVADPPRAAQARRRIAELAPPVRP